MGTPRWLEAGCAAAGLQYRDYLLLMGRGPVSEARRKGPIGMGTTSELSWATARDAGRNPRVLGALLLLLLLPQWPCPRPKGREKGISTPKPPSSMVAPSASAAKEANPLSFWVRPLLLF